MEGEQFLVICNSGASAPSTAALSCKLNYLHNPKPSHILLCLLGCKSGLERPKLSKTAKKLFNHETFGCEENYAALQRLPLASDAILRNASLNEEKLRPQLLALLLCARPECEPAVCLIHPS
jgi:hypothetical protein